jgi:DNA-binding NarL/FixJ family response regulator
VGEGDERGDRASVVIAESHPLVRAGLREALTAAFAVRADVGTTDDALRAVAVHLPEVCLVDIGLDDSLELIVQITTRSPGTEVVLTAFDSSADAVFAAVLAGARGLVHKDVHPGEVVEIVSTVLRGEAALPDYMTTRLLDAAQGRRQRLMRSRDN